VMIIVRLLQELNVRPSLIYKKQWIRLYQIVTTNLAVNAAILNVNANVTQLIPIAKNTKLQ
jgi:hypothetical protein